MIFVIPGSVYGKRLYTSWNSMPLPLIYHKCVVIYSLILPYLSNKKAKAHWNSPNVKSMQVFYGHLCLSEVICMYVRLWYSKNNTNMIFHTCDVVGSRGCVLYIRGWVSHMALILYGFHYLFISYLFVSRHPRFRSVILWILFISSLCIVLFCTSEIECYSHAGFV